MKYYFKGHQNYKNPNFVFLNLLGKIGYVKTFYLTSCKSDALQFKVHGVTHLKALDIW